MPDLDVPHGWKERLESLAGSRRDLWLAIAVVGAVMAGALILRFRTPPPLVAPPSTAPAPSTITGPTPGTSISPTGAALFVHVAGAVRDPGLYELPDGARVADAIEAAGGETTKADLGAINLAEVLVDGAKVDVPKHAALGSSETSSATPAPSIPTTTQTAATTVIDLNTADSVALETIPGIGPVLAGAIVQHRDENGPFPSVDALLDVSGIGPATLESVRPYVRV